MFNQVGRSSMTLIKPQKKTWLIQNLPSLCVLVDRQQSYLYNEDAGDSNTSNKMIVYTLQERDQSLLGTTDFSLGQTEVGQSKPVYHSKCSGSVSRIYVTRVVAFKIDVYHKTWIDISFQIHFNNSLSICKIVELVTRCWLYCCHYVFNMVLSCIHVHIETHSTNETPRSTCLHYIMCFSAIYSSYSAISQTESWSKLRRNIFQGDIFFNLSGHFCLSCST